MHTSKYKGKTSLSPFFFVVGFISLFIYFSIPSGVPSWFDGLPWSGALETVVLTAILPFLLIGQRRFLASKRILLILLSMLALKLILVLWAPASGWEVKAYESPQSLAAGKWEPTYQSIWRNQASAILDRPWVSAEQFPIEWMNRYDANKRKDLRLILNIRGWALIPAGEKLILQANGAARSSLCIYDRNGHRWKMPVLKGAKNDQAVASQEGPDGACRVEGEIFFDKRGNWSLVPLLQDSAGRLKPALDQLALWQGHNVVQAGSGLLAGLRWLSRILDWVTLLFLAAWAGNLLHGLWRQSYLNPWLVCLAAFGLAAPLALSKVPQIAALDPTGIMPLAAAMTIAAAVLTGYAFSRKGADHLGGLDPAKFVMFVLGPGIIGYLIINWWYQLGAMHFYSIGDDWLVYQNYGRLIFVGGDWWSSFEPIIFYQPGYRYIVGLLHTFFGQSALAQHMLDAWAVAGGAALLTALARLMGALPGWAILGCALYLANELAGGFRHHIGRSMSEHAGMLFMMMAIWGAMRSRESTPGRVLYPAMAAVIGFWVRMDHLGTLAVAGLFRQPGLGAGWLATWRNWLADLWRDRNWVLLYWLVLLLAVLAVLLRNEIMGGLFVLVDPENTGRWDVDSLYGAWLGIARVLNADDHALKFPAFVLWPGALAGLLALIWRRGLFTGYPLSLALSIVATLIPYLFLLPNGSPPRFSVHLLPLACLSLVLVGNGIMQTKRKRHSSHTPDSYQSMP